MQQQLDRFNHLKEQQESVQEPVQEQSKEEQLEKFRKREEAEKKALEEYAEKARQEIIEEVYPNPDDYERQYREEDLNDKPELEKSREDEVKEQYWKKDIDKDELPDPDNDQSKKKD
jgi:hypothetical protein